jgi:hypothetical protein
VEGRELKPSRESGPPGGDPLRGRIGGVPGGRTLLVLRMVAGWGSPQRTERGAAPKGASGVPRLPEEFRRLQTANRDLRRVDPLTGHIWGGYVLGASMLARESDSRSEAPGRGEQRSAARRRAGEPGPYGEARRFEATWPACCT